MTESKITMLYPCKGTEELGIERGHLYSVDSKKGPFATKFEAGQKYTKRINLLTSDEESLCPICKAYEDGKLEINLLK